MLQELQKVCEKLVIVCNGKLDYEGLESFYKITKDVVTRENTGFDIWGYKTGIDYIGWDSLKQYDELILMNDSVFGPFYPFRSMFDDMDPKNPDFWGITKHGEFNNPDGLTKCGVFPEHIQSYFYVIGKKMFLHPEFIKYWDELREFKSWNETVSFFESQFTKHFADLGFSWDVYVNTDNEFADYYDCSQILQLVYELVKDYKCPVMKRKSFTIEYENFIYFNLGTGTRKAFDYIGKNTEYDVNLIWDHILRTGCYRYIKDNLHLNYILPEGYVTGEAIDINNVKAALFAHITYEDQIGFCNEYMESVNGIADVYITTINGHLEKCLIDRFGENEFKSLKIILLPAGSKGRDVAALWVALKQYMDNYDYICFIHNKKSPQTRPLTIGRGFSERCMLNTLASKEYVMNVLKTFEDNPRLGMMFPPPVIHGPYRRLISGLWGSNYKNTLKLAKRLQINVPIDEFIDPVFPTGGMFWFKPEALKKVKDHNWVYEDFPDEPLPGDGTLGHAFERIYCFAAQSEGFYSSWLMTDVFATSEITSMGRMLSVRQYASFALYRQIFLNWLRKYPGTYNFLRSIFRFCKRTVRRVRGE